jgi:hypothetical protein
MALQFISLDSFPTYTALSTDIVSNKIAGASLIGKTVFTTDDNAWYIITGSSLELATFKLPAATGFAQEC